MNMKHPLLNAEGNSTAAPATPIAAAPVAPVLTAPLTKPVVVEKPVVSDKFASKFAALDKKGREIAAREAAIAKREAELVDPRALAKTDPVKAAEMLGITYEEMTRHILETAKPRTTEGKLTEVEKRLQQLQDDIKNREVNAQKAIQEQAQASTMEDISNLISTEVDAYELIRETQNAQLVWDVMENYFHTHKKILSVQEACDHTEKYLDSQLDKTVQWKKVKSRFEKKLDASTPPPVAAPTAGTPAPKTVTLTESMSVAPRVSAEKHNGLRTLSRDNDIAEAAKLLKFTKTG
jgi:hypothetical protein